MAIINCDYHSLPRYFAELDFDWDLDLELVKGITNSVINIAAETVCTFYKCGEIRPKCLVSMRTPYKVWPYGTAFVLILVILQLIMILVNHPWPQIHLNFPEVVTTDPLAHMCRDEIVARCRAAFGTDGLGDMASTSALGVSVPEYSGDGGEPHRQSPMHSGGDECADLNGEEERMESTGPLGRGHQVDTPPVAGQPVSPALRALDWERIIDFPHGSLRLLGSRKAKHMMKSDPDWVVDKASAEGL